ncbi:MAG: tetratricopeptide repeat protein, partial [Leucothrix sp.]
MNSNHSQQLFTKPILALIAIVLIGFLLLLFPWKSASFLDKQAPSNLKEQFSSRLLTEYHEALRQTNLTNQQALLLASQLTQKGLWKQSGELLNEKLKQPTLSDEQKKQLSTIQLRNYLDAYYTAAASGEDFDNTQQNVRQHLQDLEDYQNLSNNELIALAKASTNFGLLPQAVKIYSRLAEVDIPQQAKWLAEAGRWSAHAGDPVSAAKAFKAASQLVSGNDHYNAYTYAWLKAANKAGQRDEVKAFLDEAKYPLPSSVNALVLLANASLEAGLPESASDLFGHLAKQDSPENAQRWLEKAAHWAAETKSYAKAVNYLKQAHELTSVDSDHWSINQRMIEFYVKDEQPDAALAIISPMIKANPSSVSLLKKGIELSILEKDIPMARRWNQRYLAMQPKSLDALIGRADIETLDEDFPTANNYIKRAVKIAPKDFKLRERWAYLEETQGNEKLALQLWQWMHEQTNKAKYQQQIIRMAQADLQGKGLPLLLKLSQKTELPTQAVSDVFFHLSKQKDNTKAEQFILNHMEQYGTDQKLMQNLAQWYGSKQRHPEALTTWNSIEKRYGLNPEQNLLRFELYWATEDTDRTFQLWRNHHTQWVSLAKPHQLAIMAEVTWRYQQPRSSLAYYKTLLKLTPKQKPKARIFYHTRIALLHNNLKQYPQALSAFKRGFMETANADLLLNGLQATLDAKQYAGFNQLLELSREQTSLFANNPRYWLMQAAVASQQLQYAQALPLYNKALTLQPDSKEALAGIKSINTVLTDVKQQATLKQLVAMQDAFDAKDHRLLASLLKASEAKLAAFADLEQYWLIRSQFHFQQKQFSQAISDYQALLKLKPDSIPARQGIILGLTQLKDYTSLQRALTRWERFAENNDALWPNYAIAYQAMQQYLASVKWFEMASIKHPENYAMLLSYAESLDKLKRPADAQKVRAFGVTQLTQRLRENTLTPIERKEALFQYLSVLSKVGTQAQFDQTYAELDQTTQSKPDKDRLNEIAIAWALDKNNLNQLRRLLARNDVKQMNKPLWMSLSIALKLKDKAGLIAVLKQSDKLSTSNHISALLALGRKQRAFEVAKQAMRSGKT